MLNFKKKLEILTLILFIDRRGRCKTMSHLQNEALCGPAGYTGCKKNDAIIFMGKFVGRQTTENKIEMRSSLNETNGVVNHMEEEGDKSRSVRILFRTYRQVCLVSVEPRSAEQSLPYL